MYPKVKYMKSGLGREEIIQGERIEEKVKRMLENKEPITDGAPEIFTQRKDGVNPAYDIRTDRWEIAVDGMDAMAKKADIGETPPKAEAQAEATGGEEAGTPAE